MGLLFTGCSADDLQGPAGDGVSESDQAYYVSMSISGDGAQSRAVGDNGTPVEGTDFEDGTPNSENLINNAYFVFYDSEGNVVGDIVPVELDDSHLAEVTTPDGTVERRYKSVVQVSVKKGERKPAQVICYINPISPSTLQNPLNVIQTISRTATWSTIGGNATKYFAMSNSVYYPRAEGSSTGLAPAKGLPQVAVKIPETYLYTSEQAAEEALGSDNTLNIYVERYATKLAFKAVDPTNYITATRVYNRTAENQLTTSTTTKRVTLSFVPQYWAVNAESNRSYVIKSFRQESELGEILADNYEFGALNARINANKYDETIHGWDYDGVTVLDANNRWAWNNPDLHRSFWGMSPAYFTAEYPEVSSDLKDITVNQKYISYNELKTEGNNIGFSANNTTPQYFRETTVGYRALNSKNPNAAVASVIYVGQYKLSMEGSGDLPEGTSFYTYLSGNVPDVAGQPSVTEDRPYVYFNTSAGVKSDVAGGESMFLRFLAQTTILYRKSATDEEKAAGEYTRLTIARESDLNMMVDALRVSEISDEVKKWYDGNETTKLKLQNNSRTLQFKNAEMASGIYIVTGGGYMEIVPDDTPAASFNENTQIRLSQANVTLMRQVGLSYYYTTGHAYFSIPVKHFGWYRQGNQQKNEAKIDWNRVRVGDFGMVRNHSYQVNVTEILGLASGIGDDDNPIVPPANTEDYFLAYSVNILKWAVVPVQPVKL